MKRTPLDLIANHRRSAQNHPENTVIEFRDRDNGDLEVVIAHFESKNSDAFLEEVFVFDASSGYLLSEMSRRLNTGDSDVLAIAWGQDDDVEGEVYFPKSASRTFMDHGGTRTLFSKQWEFFDTKLNTRIPSDVFTLEHLDMSSDAIVMDRIKNENYDLQFSEFN